MYSSVSNNFRTECKRDVNVYKRIAKIHVVEDNIDITNDDDLVDFTIEEMAYSENTFIGNSVAKKISLKIINDGSYNLENKEIEVYVGIDYVGDGSNTELIPYGNFIISKPLNEEVKDTSNYVGYDYMIKTEVPFAESNIVYPMSLYNYLSAICTSVGITLGNQSIPNGDYQILGNAYTNGESIRQIIEEIARCCGGFAVIGRDNKLYIKTLNVQNKNTLKFTQAKTSTSGGLTATCNDNATITINGTSSSMVAMGFDLDTKLLNGTYKLSGYTRSDTYLQLYTKNSSGTIRVINMRNTPTLSFDNETLFRVFIFVANGTTATFNNETFNLMLEPDYTETITPGEYFEDFGTANTYGPVNRVAIALNYNVIGEDTIREDAESIVQNGLTEVRVSDISFLNSEAQRELVVDDFWESLHGLTYKPYLTNYYGYPYVDVGDIVKITKPDNTYFYSYILNHKFTYNGAFSGNIEAPALSDVEDEYKQTSTLRSTLRNTELKVDKINGEIQGIIEEIGDRSEKQTTVTQDIDSIELAVQDLEDLTYEVDGMNPITLEECVAGELLTLRIRGNNTVFDGLRPSNTLVPSNTLYPYGDSFLILKHYTENEQHEIVETIERIDLKITQPLRYMSTSVFDEFRYDYDAEQKARVIRRIGLTNNGEMYALAQEVIEPVDIDDIVLTQGTNIIDIGVPYQANVYADYVRQNEFTKIFTTQYQVSTQILQLANQISLIVSEKVGKDEIVAEINLAVEDEQGIIDIHGNQIKIKSDYFELTADGQITARRGIIGDLILHKQSNGSYLYKNFTSDGVNYQSGLFIPTSITNLNTPFLYAGFNRDELQYIEDANLVINHDGSMKVKRINMNGESGYVKINYNSGREAMNMTVKGIDWKIDNSSNNKFCYVGRSNYTMQLQLFDAQCFNFADGVHNLVMGQWFKYNPNETEESLGKLGNWFTMQSDLAVAGYRHNGVNYTMYIHGYEVATNASDERLKENIENSTDNALDKINAIKIRQFDWRTDRHLKQGGQHINNGYIAQEVQEIDETLVNYNKEFDTYAMDVLNLSALQAKAIQELNEIVKKQQEDIDYLKEEIKKLKGEK